MKLELEYNIYDTKIENKNYDTKIENKNRKQKQNTIIREAGLDHGLEHG